MKVKVLLEVLKIKKNLSCDFMLFELLLQAGDVFSVLFFRGKSDILLELIRPKK